MVEPVCIAWRQLATEWAHPPSADTNTTLARFMCTTKVHHLHAVGKNEDRAHERRTGVYIDDIEIGLVDNFVYTLVFKTVFITCAVISWR